MKIPIWAFINQGERAGVESMVAAVQAAGGNAYLTVADAPGHNAWSAPLQGGILSGFSPSGAGRSAGPRRAMILGNGGTSSRSLPQCSPSCAWHGGASSGGDASSARPQLGLKSNAMIEDRVDD